MIQQSQSDIGHGNPVRKRNRSAGGIKVIGACPIFVYSLAEF